jgi:hypothetical protein
MTPAIVGGIVAVVVVLLACLGWVVLRMRRVVKIETPEEAADAAQAQLRGFAVAGAVVGADGQGALAIAASIWQYAKCRGALCGRRMRVSWSRPGTRRWGRLCSRRSMSSTSAGWRRRMYGSDDPLTPR